VTSRISIDPETLRTRRERSLAEELLAESDVAYALKKVEERHGGYGFMGRRSLLTGALRLTRSMAPVIADTVARCRSVLGFERPIEFYVRADSEFRASAVNISRIREETTMMSGLPSQRIAEARNSESART
jgi:hypothetical protein